MRNQGLSANQLLHVPLAGDFQMSHISSHDPPHALGKQAAPHKKLQQQQQAAGDRMEASGEGAAVLATADPESREALVRENAADPLAGEQTWPTEQVSDIDRPIYACCMTHVIQSYISANFGSVRLSTHDERCCLTLVTHSGIAWSAGVQGGLLHGMQGIATSR